MVAGSQAGGEVACCHGSAPLLRRSVAAEHAAEGPADHVRCAGCAGACCPQRAWLAGRLSPHAFVGLVAAILNSRPCLLLRTVRAQAQAGCLPPALTAAVSAWVKANVHCPFVIIRRGAVVSGSAGNSQMHTCTHAAALGVGLQPELRQPGIGRRKAGAQDRN